MFRNSTVGFDADLIYAVVPVVEPTCARVQWPAWEYGGLASLVTLANRDDLIERWRPNAMSGDEQAANARLSGALDRDPPHVAMLELRRHGRGFCRVYKKETIPPIALFFPAIRVGIIPEDFAFSRALCASLGAEAEPSRCKRLRGERLKLCRLRPIKVPDRHVLPRAHRIAR